MFSYIINQIKRKCSIKKNKNKATNFNLQNFNVSEFENIIKKINYSKTCQVMGINQVSAFSCGQEFAVKLASVYAGQKNKTLIIDCFSASENVFDKMLNLQTQLGLSDVLCARGSVFDSIYSTDVENLFFMPQGTFAPTPELLISGDETDVLLNGLKKGYDKILVVVKPLNVLNNYSVLKKLNGNLIVVNEQLDMEKETFNVCEKLKSEEIFVLGTVCTQIAKK